MNLLQRLLELLKRLRDKAPPSESKFTEATFMLGTLTIAGGFDGKDKAGKPEAIAAVRVYRMPGRVLMTGGTTTFAPSGAAPGVPVQHSTVFVDVDFPIGANSVVVALVDDEGTENAGVTASFTVTDQGPTEVSGAVATFVGK